MDLERGAVVRQMYDHGVKAVPVVILVAVFTGMIVCLQSGIEIRNYGQENLVGRIVAASMFREMGPFITAIILAATAGSSCAAEIGTMRVSEEIDALDMMAIDPVRFLVVPRVAALGLMCFALTVLTDAFGTLGGAFVAQAQLGVSWRTYFDGARDALGGDYFLGVLSKDVYSGLAKAFVFGIVIGLVGCATLALVPLGCASTTIRHHPDDRPRLPAATAERLRACVDELGGELAGGYYTFEATVKVDEEGRVVDVKSTGVPHPELAICMRIALRGMTVPEDLLGKLRRGCSRSEEESLGGRRGRRGGEHGVGVAQSEQRRDVAFEQAGRGGGQGGRIGFAVLDAPVPVDTPFR